MGREAVARCHWQGQVGDARILLESAEIILRGDVRARIPRGDIADIVVDGGMLRLSVAGAPLAIELGAEAAAKWASALRKPLPTLAEKLGVDAAHPAFVIGAVDDAVLAAALSGSTTPVREDAAMLVAVLHDEAALHTALTLARDTPEVPLWFVHPKGKGAAVTDAMVRGVMRGAGFVDNKTSSVSDRLTATRYRLRSSV